MHALSTAILDARGQPLFKLKKQLLSLHSTYIGYAPTSKEEIFTVKSSFSFGTKLTATFCNVAGDGREMELVLRGNILDRSAEITTREGVPVARISRSFANAGEIFCTYGALCPFGNLLIPSSSSRQADVYRHHRSGRRRRPSAGHLYLSRAYLSCHPSRLAR